MTAGARVGPGIQDRYRIERELGQGGMATVYLAYDIRHDRRVALKVLRPELSAILGAERFLAEIKTTANLQHPHILSLFDSGESGGLVYYVMPYVEGESLRDRISRDHQLPVDEALRIAKEVADALQYAHQHGIVHRDIKPENILLHGGHAMVADFGIALAASRSEGGARMTETGMSLGTPQYMAPEQAMGERDITPRADIYALGCVTYEMLTGEPPFTGPTAQAIVARVMTDQPRSVTGQRHTVPPYVDAAIRTALEKLPADRYGSAAEFAAALDSTAALRGDPTAPYRSLTGARPVLRYQPSLALFIASILILAGGIWSWSRKSGSSAPISWSYIRLSDTVVLSAPQVPGPAFAISPDGASLVMRDNSNSFRLWLKRRGDLTLTQLPGTELSANPVFSPDGQSIAFVSNGQLKKIRVSGGAAVTVADSVAGGFGGVTWLDNENLVFVTPTLQQLRKVPAAGGTAVVLLRDSSGGGLSTLNPLPGGRGVLFQMCTSGCVTSEIRALDLRTGQQKRLIPNGVEAWLLPDGQLFYVRRDGVGLISAFDLGKLELKGAATPILDQVMVTFGGARLAWAKDGTLIYQTSPGTANGLEVVRVTTAGAESPIDTAWSGAFNDLSMSPDGTRLAIGAGNSAGTLDIWIKQLDHGPFTRLTFSGNDRRPAWSPDGRLVAFVRDSAGGSSAMVKAADGSSAERRVAHLDRQIQEVTWTRDGTALLVRTDNGAAGQGDILSASLSGHGETTPIVASPFQEIEPRVSPDGRWLAYVSNETGTDETYVRPFPDAARARYQVSTNGGESPVWSPDGRTLYFIDLAGRINAASVTATGANFAVGAERHLFTANDLVCAGFHQCLDVNRDGRLVYLRIHAAQALAGAPLVMATNWFADIRARLKP